MKAALARQLTATGLWRIALAIGLVVCVSTLTWAGGAYYLSGHGSTGTGVYRVPSLYGQGECGHCHEMHASQDVNTTLYPYTLFALEENVCWACHNGTVTYAADTRSPVATPPANTSTDFYKHPISNLYSGLTPSAHRAGESAPSAFGGSSRHAECTDCHDPHVAKNTGVPGVSTHTPGGANGNRLSPALLGATGLVVTSWQAAGMSFTGAAASLQTLSSPTTNYEWQLCFKCHSGFTALPTYTVGSGYFLATKITSTTAGQVQEYRDVGQAYNPNNLAYHPVTAVGENALIPPGSFVSPWSATSTMCCSDCHNRAVGATGGVGPHGSASMHLLERADYLQENTHVTTGSDQNELCFKCHRWQTYVSGSDPASNTLFQRAGSNLHRLHMNLSAYGTPSGRVVCYSCHDVHGTNYPHLINFNRQYVTPGGERDSQTAYVHGSTTGSGSCYLTCHGTGHNPLTYPN
jgi:hypothetical protein